MFLVSRASQSVCDTLCSFPCQCRLFSGCGHGRYLHINKTVFKVGSDVCAPLVNIAASKCDDDVMVCDNLQLPYRSASRIAFKLMLLLKDVELYFVFFVQIVLF